MWEKNKASSTIQFDILLKSAGSGNKPNLANIDQFRPSSEIIEKCYRWLSSKGVECHSTDFGLACSAPKDIFESLFSTTVLPANEGPGMPQWQCSPPPKAPPEIEDFVDQITISAKPESFS